MPHLIKDFSRRGCKQMKSDWSIPSALVNSVSFYFSIAPDLVIYTTDMSFTPMSHSGEDRDLDDIRQRTARVREKLVSLLLDAAPQRQKSKRGPSIQTIQPAIREWTENRLADLDLWTAGISVLNKPGVSYSLDLIKSTIASLLTLLSSLLDVCLSLGEQDLNYGSCADTDFQSSSGQANL